MPRWEVCRAASGVWCQQCCGSTRPCATSSGSEVCPGPEQPRPHRAAHLLPGPGGLRGSLPQAGFGCGGAGNGVMPRGAEHSLLQGAARSTVSCCCPKAGGCQQGWPSAQPASTGCQCLLPEVPSAQHLPRYLRQHPHPDEQPLAPRSVGDTWQAQSISRGQRANAFFNAL